MVEYYYEADGRIVEYALEPFKQDDWSCLYIEYVETVKFQGEFQSHYLSMQMKFAW